MGKDLEAMAGCRRGYPVQNERGPDGSRQLQGDISPGCCQEGSGVKAYAVFIDFAKAFYSLPRTAFWECLSLETSQVPASLKATQSMLTTGSYMGRTPMGLVAPLIVSKVYPSQVF